jgi:hypothetical protein
MFDELIQLLHLTVVATSTLLVAGLDIWRTGRIPPKGSHINYIFELTCIYLYGKGLSSSIQAVPISFAVLLYPFLV